jgi:transcriptional regulator with XRE-family HTH domain
MKDDINRRIARRVKDLRARHGLSLTGLSVKSGVSRSMISLIERGETSPTAAVLEKLAAGLDTSLAGLFDTPPPAAAAPGPVVRHRDQVEWRDPDSGYRRRNVTPPGLGAPFQIVEVHFPAGRTVTFDNNGRDDRLHQQVWVLSGTMEITCGQDRQRLEAGDCFAMQLDRVIAFHNPTARSARYAVVIQAPPEARR